jgi:hypothetical protein
MKLMAQHFEREFCAIPVIGNRIVSAKDKIKAKVTEGQRVQKMCV